MPAIRTQRDPVVFSQCAASRPVWPVRRVGSVEVLGAWVEWPCKLASSWWLAAPGCPRRLRDSGPSLCQGHWHCQWPADVFGLPGLCVSVEGCRRECASATFASASAESSRRLLSGRGQVRDNELSSVFCVSIGQLRGRLECTSSQEPKPVW